MGSDNHKNIDAEYMNRWLGDNAKITSLSPKVLYDVQTLLEYYRDIIVPSVDVSISFPTENGSNAKASVEDSKVFIPYYMLRDGRVDETIGAMIHELHHIKWSASEKFTCALTFKYLRKLMENIDVVGMSLAERVFSDSTLTVDDIMSEKDGVPQDVMYMRKIIGDLMFMLNAVEDVRIDANTPPNLRKYIDKIDKGGGEHFKQAIKEGTISADDMELTNIAYLLLAHHKGIHDFPFIEERYGDRDAILNGNPHEYPLEVFEAFQEEISQHILDEYIKHCGMPKQPSGDSGDEFDIDAYFGEKVNASMGDALDKQFSSRPQPKAYKAKTQAEADALEKLKEKLDKVKVKQPKKPAQGSGDIKSPYSTTKDATAINPSPLPTTPPQTAVDLRKQLEEETKEVFMSPQMAQQVKSFKDVQVHTTTEQFSDKTVVYDSVIFDATN